MTSPEEKIDWQEAWEFRASLRNEGGNSWLRVISPEAARSLLGIKEITAIDIARETATALQDAINLELAVGSSENREAANIIVLRRKEFSLRTHIEIKVYEKLRKVKIDLEQAFRQNDFNKAYDIAEEAEEKIEFESWEMGLHQKEEVYIAMLKETFFQLMRDRIKQLIVARDFKGLIKLIEIFYFDKRFQGVIEDELQTIPLKHFQNEQFLELLVSQLMQKFLKWLEYSPLGDCLVGYLGLEENGGKEPSNFEKICKLWEKIGLQFGTSEAWLKTKGSPKFIDKIMENLISLMEGNTERFLEACEILIDYILIPIETFRNNAQFMRELKMKYIFSFTENKVSDRLDWSKIVELGLLTKEETSNCNRLQFVKEFVKNEKAAGRKLIDRSIAEYLKANGQSSR